MFERKEGPEAADLRYLHACFASKPLPVRKSAMHTIRDQSILLVYLFFSIILFFPCKVIFFLASLLCFSSLLIIGKPSSNIMFITLVPHCCSWGPYAQDGGRWLMLWLVLLWEATRFFKHDKKQDQRSHMKPYASLGLLSMQTSSLNLGLTVHSKSS